MKLLRYTMCTSPDRTWPPTLYPRWKYCPSAIVSTILAPKMPTASMAPSSTCPLPLSTNWMSAWRKRGPMKTTRSLTSFQTPATAKSWPQHDTMALKSEGSSVLELATFSFCAIQCLVSSRPESKQVSFSRSGNRSVSSSWRCLPATRSSVIQLKSIWDHQLAAPSPLPTNFLMCSSSFFAPASILDMSSISVSLSCEKAVLPVLMARGFWSMPVIIMVTDRMKLMPSCCSSSSEMSPNALSISTKRTRISVYRKSTIQKHFRFLPRSTSFLFSIISTPRVPANLAASTSPSIHSALVLPVRIVAAPNRIPMTASPN
mmetsp:Transcript_44547/g.111627  ORF Transcript_44547/g.111627 Transcript_44547/m.111627 type:complete len:317 (+) Transcript_44547:3972-4922(+)